LSEQITALEQENVAEREWTMRGEVNARARPQNSLLEENLEFEQAAKVVPVVTEESSQSLEDRIKQRIIDVSIPVTSAQYNGT
jgi:U3 small nucleolar RNA-associated protein MPP10